MKKQQIIDDVLELLVEFNKNKQTKIKRYSYDQVQLRNKKRKIGYVSVNEKSVYFNLGQKNAELIINYCEQNGLDYVRKFNI